MKIKRCNNKLKDIISDNKGTSITAASILGIVLVFLLLKVIADNESRIDY